MLLVIVTQKLYGKQEKLAVYFNFFVEKNNKIIISENFGGKICIL